MPPPTTPARRNRTPFAQRVLEQALANVLPAPTPLFVQEGETFQPASDAEVLDAARYALAQHFRTGSPVLSSPRRVAEFLQVNLATREREVFAVILLDASWRFIDYVELFHGTIASVQVYPRHVLERVIAHHASAVLLVHNHPSGDARPSPDDVRLTKRVKEVLAQIDVRVLDHIIVGESVLSMESAGLLK